MSAAGIESSGAGVGAATLSQALRALAAGVATIDAAGRLLTADCRFLLLLGMDDPAGRAPAETIGRAWPHLLRRPDCRLTAEDADILEARWSTLLRASAGGAPGRASVRLADGRTLELAAATADGVAVLAVKDGTEVAASGERRLIQSGFVHDVNNTLGGMLANLYLATDDIEPGHPARRWLDAVNAAAVDLRSRLREIAGRVAARSGGSRGN